MRPTQLAQVSLCTPAEMARGSAAWPTELAQADLRAPTKLAQGSVAWPPKLALTILNITQLDSFISNRESW